MRVGRVVVIVAAAIGGWLLLSLILFIVSAATSPHQSDSTKNALSPGGSPLFGSTIAVLSLDERPPNTKEPGAGGPPHSDSIILMHVAPGSVRRVSVLRDSYAEIPGVGAQKINAAYAIGGPPLTIKTLQNFMGGGLQINHLAVFNFVEFGNFIDSVGGVNITINECIQSQPFGGQVFSLPPGTHHLNGQQALLFSRVRENRCNPSEDDRTRVLRQQQVLSAVRSKLVSPTTFFRLPWVSWEAPRAINTDLGPFGLLELFFTFATGGTGQPNVLQPYGNGPGGSLLVSPADRQQAVQQLLGH